MQETNEQYLERMLVKAQTENSLLKKQVEIYQKLIDQLEANLESAFKMNNLQDLLRHDTD